MELSECEERRCEMWAAVNAAWAAWAACRSAKGEGGEAVDKKAGEAEKAVEAFGGTQCTCEGEGRHAGPRCCACCAYEKLKRWCEHGQAKYVCLQRGWQRLVKRFKAALVRGMEGGDGKVPSLKVCDPRRCPRKRDELYRRMKEEMWLMADAHMELSEEYEESGKEDREMLVQRAQEQAAELDTATLLAVRYTRRCLQCVYQKLESRWCVAEEVPATPKYCLWRQLFASRLAPHFAKTRGFSAQHGLLPKEEAPPCCRRSMRSFEAPASGRCYGLLWTPHSGTRYAEMPAQHVLQPTRKRPARKRPTQKRPTRKRQVVVIEIDDDAEDDSGSAKRVKRQRQ